MCIDYKCETLINNQSVFQDALSADPGKLVGVRNIFHGTGAVRSLEIHSPDQVEFKTAF